MVYKIVIKLDSNSEDVIYHGKIAYSRKNFDKVDIFENRVEIELKRNKDIDIQSVLLNQNSSFSKQINKCMAFCYATSTKDVKIENIMIYKYNNKEVVESFKYENVNNPITSDETKLTFETNDLSVMLSDDTEKSKAITISLIFLLKGMTIENQGEKFENYWKCFNSLYTFISKETRENEKLYFMREFICNHKNEFQQSLNLVDKDTKSDIRKLRIRDLILNDFPSISQTKSFEQFILRYTDFRMNEVFEEILPYRIDNLKQKGMDLGVQNHIQLYKAQKLKENSDLLCFYILKYSYYLRNKYFHAEKLTPTFNFIKNNEIDELEKLNELLKTFLYELIKCNKLY